MKKFILIGFLIVLYTFIVISIDRALEVEVKFNNRIVETYFRKIK